jgi:hypothetical protein
MMSEVGNVPKKTVTSKRRLGSITQCKRCQSNIVLRSSGQKYCESCADIVLKQRRRARIEKQKQSGEMRNSTRNCRLCGLEFTHFGNKRLCSDRCVAESLRLSWYRSNIKRGKSKNTHEVPESTLDTGRFESADWSKSSREIAEELDVSYNHVSVLRRRFDSVPKEPRAMQKWKNTDWSKSNVQIAQESGLSYSSVSQYRRRFDPVSRTDRVIQKWESVDWTKSNAQIAQESGATYAYVSRLRRRFDPASKRS